MKLMFMTAITGAVLLAGLCSACVQNQSTADGNTSSSDHNPSTDTTEEIVPHVHNLKFFEGTDADCTNNGNVAYFKCSDCGKYFADKDGTTELDESDIIIQSFGHIYEPIVHYPTCTQEGYTQYVCSRCGDSYTDEESVVPPIAHNLKEEVITQPTCMEEGLKRVYCTDCDYSCEVAIDPLGHLCTETVIPPTCTEKGYTEHICTRCDYSYCDTYTETLPHTYVANIVPATCTEQGYTEYICSECGDTYRGDYTDILPHTYVANIVPATCTEQGYTEYICSECGDTYRGDYTDTLPHTYVATIVPATCTEQGYTEYICSECGDAYRGDYTETLPHEYELISQTQPTCTQEGKSCYSCVNCGAEYTITLPALGHDWQVTEEGLTPLGAPYVEYICSICQQTKRTEGEPPAPTEGLTFALTGDYYEVTGIITDKTNIALVLPAEHNGLPVKVIADGAFENNDDIVSVFIPAGIEKIGKKAFADCSMLNEANIPLTAKSVGSSAFSGCTKLAALRYDAICANDCGSMGIFAKAGTGTDGLTIWIGKYTERIPAILFGASTAATSPNITKVIFAQDGALKEIGPYAFYNCRWLERAELPATLELIESDAFTGCTSLAYVSCPESAVINPGAFSGTPADSDIVFYPVTSPRRRTIG